MRTIVVLACWTLGCGLLGALILAPYGTTTNPPTPDLVRATVLALPELWLAGCVLAIGLAVERRRAQRRSASTAGRCPSCGTNGLAASGMCPVCGAQPPDASGWIDR